MILKASAKGFKIFLLPAALLLFFPLFAALAQNQPQDLQTLQREIEERKSHANELKQKAEKAKRDAKAFSQQLVSKGGEIRVLEEKINANEASLIALTAEAALKKTQIEAEHENMSLTLAALQRLSRTPPEILLLRPEDALTTVRTASLLSETLPEIKAKAERLKEDLTELAALKAKLVETQGLLAENLASLKAEQENLKGIQGQKQALYREVSDSLKKENQRLQKLAREAKDLEALLKRLEKERAEAESGIFSKPSFPAGTSFARAKGMLPFPASGRVVERFGDKIAGGLAKGIQIEARAGAEVMAPFDGQILFAGPFRTYGLLLIIAHGDGYHSLLAGLNRIDGEVGQWVLAGEPLGTLPETVVASSSGQLGAHHAILYLEFRKNGAPFNPLPWLKK